MMLHLGQAIKQNIDHNEVFSIHLAILVFVSEFKSNHHSFLQIHSMRPHHRHRRHRPEVCRASRRLLIYHAKLAKIHRTHRNDTCVVRADTPATTKKPHLGRVLNHTNLLQIVGIKLSFSIYICSISNFPNYDPHMLPPVRFLDVKPNDKKSINSPRIRANAKLQREAFQINV